MSYAIELKNLSYTYGENTAFKSLAVDNFSVGIEEKSITGIIGHTGSGKSTLVQMMNGLLTPSSGEVLLFGENIFKDKKTLYNARFKVGLVFQYPEYQLFEETVEKDICYGLKNLKLPENEMPERIRRAIGFVGLDETILDKSPFELSGGQKRRVAIAGIIAMMPDVLILDEPASGLDPVGKKVIFDGLKDYRDSLSKTVIIVSHSMEDMAKYADNIIVMNHGRCSLAGPADEIFTHSDELVSMGLDVPQITKVCDGLRKHGFSLPEKIYSVDAAADAIAKYLKAGEVDD
ncbi:MAG: energy-coupling factor transporter ATPase [Clostridia bacterium]|nr:energy-coupling factor transporter ATPase [Clostridia bacterium]